MFGEQGGWGKKMNDTRKEIDHKEIANIPKSNTYKTLASLKEKCTLTAHKYIECGPDR